MYVAPASVGGVVAYIDGFNAARGGGPLAGFREWLVVRVNGGNNLHWARLVSLLTSPHTVQDAAAKQEVLWIQALGNVLAEYLRYRHDNGITKVYYDYGRWLLRHRWYLGPLRKKTEGPT
jgi:hypothetical protein